MFEAGNLPFVDELAARGPALAVVTADGTPISYAELAERVEAAGAPLGTVRRLVLVEMADGLDSLVTYLAALRGRHPVLLTEAGHPERTAALVARYDPDVVAGPGADGWRLTERRAGTAHELHPGLALLLSTSGSTGSPKLVRLSAAGVVANAAAIAEYLDIRPSDRAALTLPLHYCYGLSVLHSNLSRGAAVLLPGRSVADAGFWEYFTEHRGTSIHGVPYTFELLDGVGFPRMRLPHLRYVTQAGGRLAPATVRRYAELGARHGWRLFVMYGQTEATARMAYLPPELAAEHPTAVGVPVPGGAFTISEPDRDGVGELVYHGPNVMLGYAESPRDLALGRTVHALRTGDLADTLPGGLLRIVGRRSRFVKPLGVRVDLDRLEALLTDAGVQAACTGTDDELAIAVTSRSGVAAARRVVTTRLRLPADRVRVARVPRLPRLANGKLDHQAVAAIVARESSRSDRHRRRPRTVHEAFAEVFGMAELPATATFVGLGGDSLSYVRMTVALQQVLGHVPDGWPTMTVDELARTGRPARRFASTETAVVLRALAIVLVVGSHVGLFHVLGGAHLLLAVAGWAFARFVLASSSPSRSILRSAARIAVPSMLWIAGRALVKDDIDLPNALLLNYLIDPQTWGYWYVETLTQILLLLAALLAVPAVFRAERRYPFAFPVVLLGIALAGRAFPDAGNEFSDRLMSAHLVLWLFVLGWVVQRARTGPQRCAAGLLALGLVPGFFDDPVRTAVVTVGVGLLLVVRRVPLPRELVGPLGAVANASLWIYLTHYAIYPSLLRFLPDAAVVAVCLVAGVLVDRAVTALGRRVRWRGSAPAATRARGAEPPTPDGHVAAPPTRPAPAAPMAVAD